MIRVLMRITTSGVWTAGDYGWITPDMAIHRDYGLDDLQARFWAVSMARNYSGRAKPKPKRIIC